MVCVYFLRQLHLLITVLEPIELLVPHPPFLGNSFFADDLPFNFLYKSSKCFLLHFWLSIGLILELVSRNLHIYGIWYALGNNPGFDVLWFYSWFVIFVQNLLSFLFQGPAILGCVFSRIPIFSFKNFTNFRNFAQNSIFRTTFGQGSCFPVGCGWLDHLDTKLIDFVWV